MKELLEKADFDKGDGLLPAIIQDALTDQVLMLGYVSAESLSKTIETGLVTFFSRSRQTLWTKGKTSGNTLSLIDIALDCDNDSFLIKAKPAGPTCHLGSTSCFGEKEFSLSALVTLIEGRKNADTSDSYTAKLLQGPMTKAAQKVGEEGVETALAAVAEDDESLIGESADLLYHLMVVLAKRGLSLSDVKAELARRHKPE